MCGFLRGCGLYQPSPPTVRFADETPAGRPGPDAIRPRAAASPTRPPDGPRRRGVRPPRPRGTGVSLPLSDAPPRTVGTAAAPRREPPIEPGTRSAGRPATDSGLPGTHRHRRDRPGAAPRRPAAREAPAPLAEVRVTLRRRRGGSRRKHRQPPGEVEGRPAAAKTDARAAVSRWAGCPVFHWPVFHWTVFHWTERRVRARLAVCYPAFALLRLLRHRYRPAPPGHPVPSDERPL